MCKLVVIAQPAQALHEARKREKVKPVKDDERRREDAEQKLAKLEFLKSQERSEKRKKEEEKRKKKACDLKVT